MPDRDQQCSRSGVMEPTVLVRFHSRAVRDNVLFATVYFIGNICLYFSFVSFLVIPKSVRLFTITLFVVYHRWPAIMVVSFWQPAVACFNWFIYCVVCDMANKILCLSLSC